MSVIIRLQNLPWSASALDIRKFFHGLSVPDGGVHIVGGEKGDAFIAFSTDEDARKAMQMDSCKLKDMSVKLLLSSKVEMQQVIAQARGGGGGTPAGPPPPQNNFSGQGMRSGPPRHPGENYPPENRGMITGGPVGQSNPPMGPHGGIDMNKFPDQNTSRSNMGGPHQAPFMDNRSGPPHGDRYPPNSHMGGGPPMGMMPNQGNQQGPPGDQRQFGNLNNQGPPQPSGFQGGLPPRDNFGGNMSGPPPMSMPGNMPPRDSSIGGDMRGMAPQFGGQAPNMNNPGFRQDIPPNSMNFGGNFGPSDRDMPMMGNRDGPVMGNRDGPLMGNRDMPVMGNRDGPVMGNRDGPVMGNRDGPMMGNRDVMGMGGGRDMPMDDMRVMGNRDMDRKFDLPGNRMMGPNDGPPPNGQHGGPMGGPGDFGYNNRGDMGVGMDHRGGMIDERRDNQWNKPKGPPPPRNPSYERGLNREFHGHSPEPDRYMGHGGRQSRPIDRHDEPFQENRGIKRRYDGSDRCVYVSNLPFTVTFKDVRRFFSGCEIPRDGLKLINDRYGRRNGSAFIQFSNDKNVDDALRLVGESIGGRPVRIKRCSQPEFDEAIDSYVPKPIDTVRPPSPKRPRSRTPTPPRDPSPSSKTCVMLRNLPSKVERLDIRRFFDALKIPPSGIYIEYDKSGRANGTAYVDFGSPSEYLESLKYHGHRLNGVEIDIYSIEREEMQTSIAKHKDSQKANRRSSPPGGQRDSTSPPRNSNTSRTERAQTPPQTEQSHSSPSENNSTTENRKYYCVKLKGLPYETTHRTLKDFFTGLEISSRGIHLMQNNEGQASGVAFVEFISSTDCEKALQKNKEYIGRRYINISPILKKDMLLEINDHKFNRHTGGPPPMHMGNNDGHMSHRDQMPMGHRDQIPIGHRDPMPMGNRDQMPMGHRDPMPMGHRAPMPMGNRDPMPMGNRDQMPMDHRDQMPMDHRDRMPMDNRDQMPMGHNHRGDHYQGNMGPGGNRPMGGGGPGGDECQMIIKNLNFRSTENDLEMFFRGYGIIPGSVRLKFNDHGRPAGEALVMFHNITEAQNAKRDLNQRLLDGRPLVLYIN